MNNNPRQLALIALRDIYKKGAYTNIALDRVLRLAQINNLDRGLACELVYGVVRRQRTLDALIDQLGKKKATQQPPDLRIILHIGLYQLRYLNQVPASAAIHTSVELAKTNGYKKLGGVVNAILRSYQRQALEGEPLYSDQGKPLQLAADADPVKLLGVRHSFPDWIVKIWLERFGLEESDRLCAWFNQTPTIDLRVNILQTSITEVIAAFAQAGIPVCSVPHLPQALRLNNNRGGIEKLPGFHEGWWTVQDSSAQLVSHLLAPQSGETIIDACAAPGGKTTHLAELMGDQGTIFACDLYAKRLKKLSDNCRRLGLKSIQIKAGDSRDCSQFTNLADRVLIDPPCSGLGILHKRPDIRWRQTLTKTKELSCLQKELLDQASTWVKPGGMLVYSTCTLNSLENQEVIQSFLHSHSHWQIQPPPLQDIFTPFATKEGWLEILPHQQEMDGFFMVKLKNNEQ